MAKGNNMGGAMGAGRGTIGGVGTPLGPQVNPNASAIGASNQQEVLARLMAALSANRGSNALSAPGTPMMPMASPSPVEPSPNGPPIFRGPMPTPQLGAVSGDMPMPMPAANPNPGNITPGGGFNERVSAPAIGPSDSGGFLKKFANRG